MLSANALSIFSTVAVLISSTLWFVGIKQLLIYALRWKFDRNAIESSNFEQEGFRAKGFVCNWLVNITIEELHVNVLLPQEASSKNTYMSRFIAYCVCYGFILAELLCSVVIQKLVIRIRKSDTSLIIECVEGKLFKEACLLSISALKVKNADTVIAHSSVCIKREGSLFKVALDDALDVTINLEDLLLFDSLSDEQKSESSLLESVARFFALEIRLRPLDITLKLLLPTIDVKESCFAEATLALDNFGAEFRYGQRFTLHTEQLTFGTTLRPLDSRLRVFCKADRLLQQTLFEHENPSFELLHARGVSVPLYYDNVSFKESKLWFYHISGQQCSLESACALRIPITTHFLKVTLPFQFPLGSLVEHASMLFKAGLNLGNERSDPMRLFKLPWNISLSTYQVEFTIADDPFESSIDRIHRTWSSFVHTRDSLVEEFWRHTKGWTSLDEAGSVHEADPLLRFCEHPETQMAGFRNAYAKLQDALLATYRSRFLQTSRSLALLSVTAKDVSLDFSWHPELLSGIDGQSILTAYAKLLALLDRSEHLPPDVANFDTNLGGLMCLSFSDLRMYIRPYHEHSPQCLSIPRARIEGPFFICEEHPWGDPACYQCPVDYGSTSIKVVRSAMPIKLYRAFKWHIDSPCNQTARLNILPRHVLGLIAADLDRAFDLCTRPSIDQSPPLAIWDKLRLIFRGWHDVISFDTTTVLSCAFSKRDAYDLEGLIHQRLSVMNDAPQETIECAFPDGFTLSALADQDIPIIHLRIPRVSMVLKEAAEMSYSRDLSALFHQMKSSAFIEESRLTIAELPACEFSMTVVLKGKDGTPLCSHDQLKPKVGPCALDSFADFRTQSITSALTVNITPSHPLHVFFYRQLEAWIVRRFGRFLLDPDVKKGQLWTIPVCQIGDDLAFYPKPRLSAIFTAFSLRIKSFRNADVPSVNVTGMSWSGLGSFAGTSLSARSGSLFLSWRKSDAAWAMYFGEAELKEACISVRTNRTSESNELDVSNDPKWSCFNVFHSSLLVYFFIDQTCFNADASARATQLLEATCRLEEIEAKIIDVSKRLHRCDPIVSPLLFSNIKAALSSLIDRRDHVVAFLKSADGNGRPRASFHRYMINWAKLAWHQELRDIVFRLIDEQLQATLHRRSRSFTLRSRLLASLAEPLPETDEQRRRKSSEDRHDSLQHEVFRQLLTDVDEHGSPIEASAEDKGTSDLRWPHDLIGALMDVLCIPSITEIEFIKPQLCFLSEIGAVILLADRAHIEYCAIKSIDQLCGRRTKLELGHVVFWASFRSEASEWPPFHADTVDVAVSMKRISDPATISVVYDATAGNPEALKQAGYRKCPAALLDGRDSIQFACDRLAVRTNSLQFTLLLDLVRNLLIYRDPTQTARSEQRETLVVAATKLTGRQQGFQQSIDRLLHDLELAEQEYMTSLGGLHADERFQCIQAVQNDLALIVDALQDAREQWDRLSRRQTRLDLEVTVNTLQWSLLVPPDDNTTERSRQVVLCEMSLSRAYDLWCSLEDGSETNRIAIRTFQITNRLPSAFYITILQPIRQEETSSETNVATAFWHLSLPVDGLDCYRQVQIDVAPLRVQLTHDIVGRLIVFFFPESAKEQASTIDDDVKSTTDSVKSGSPRPTLHMTLTRTDSVSSTSLLLADELVEQARELRKRYETYAIFKHIIVHSDYHVFSYKVPF